MRFVVAAIASLLATDALSSEATPDNYRLWSALSG
jgi:hypothetical protein